jgi:putative transposase
MTHKSANEIARITGLTPRRIKQIAASENWAYIEKFSRGGAMRLFEITDDVLMRFSQAVKVELPPTPTPEFFSPNGADLPPVPAIAGAAPPSANTAPAHFFETQPTMKECGGGLDAAALARSDLVRFYIAAIDAAPFTKKTQARKDFVRLYNTGELYPEIFARVGPTSWQSLERWKLRGRENNFGPIADRRAGALRRKTIFSDEQGEIILGLIRHPNRLTISEAISLGRKIMAARGIQDGHSESTYRRFIKLYKKYHFAEYTACREGVQALNDKCLPYIERDYNKLAVGDVVVADGHKLNFETIHPFTGKPTRLMMILFYDMKSNYPLGWEIMPTENTTSIHSALRRAIITLGKIPRVAYLDNGKAFSARHFAGQDLTQLGFTGLFARLGIQTIFAWPYHGQSKTIERFFKTFGFIERLAPSSVGENVYKKPPRLNRGERLHRAVYEKMTGGRALSLEETSVLINWFMEEYSNTVCRGGHLKGLRPRDVFEAGRGPGVELRDLDYLMLAATEKTIHRNGVSLFGRNWWAPELFGRKHKVTIRYDIQDLSAVLVYDEFGRFICRAEPVPKIHPAAFALGTGADRAALERQIAIKKSCEKWATQSMREYLKTEAYPIQNEFMKSIGAGEFSEGRTQDSPLPIPPNINEIREEAAALIRMNDSAREDELRRFWDSLTDTPDGDRYDKLLELESHGTELPVEQKTFMRFFEQSEYYARHREHYQERAVTYALMREM